MFLPRRLIACLIVLSTFLFATGAHSQSALIVVLGDSNTAGFGGGREKAFPALLQAMLRRNGYDVQVANAGITGDTLRGMLARLDRDVPQGTRLVIVQGGYNDVLAGSSAATLAASIEAYCLASPRGGSRPCYVASTIAAGIPSAVRWAGRMAQSSSMAARVTTPNIGVGMACT
jgi:lysophospholipase L1-like esterase